MIITKRIACGLSPEYVTWVVTTFRSAFRASSSSSSLVNQPLNWFQIFLALLSLRAGISGTSSGRALSSQPGGGGGSSPLWTLRGRTMILILSHATNLKLTFLNSDTETLFYTRDSSLASVQLQRGWAAKLVGAPG